MAFVRPQPCALGPDQCRGGSRGALPRRGRSQGEGRCARSRRLCTQKVPSGGVLSSDTFLALRDRLLTRLGAAVNPRSKRLRCRSAKNPRYSEPELATSASDHRVPPSRGPASEQGRLENKDLVLATIPPGGTEGKPPGIYRL